MYRLLLTVAAVVILCCSITQIKASEEKINVLCTTFPVYQITRNVVKDSENINLQLMLPAAMGCPHDYVLTPHDMRKLASAQVLVINGLGMESFIGAPTKKANSKIQIIDSSTGINDLLEYIHDGEYHEEESEHHHDEEAEHHNGEEAEHHHHHDGEAEHHHHHEGINPHLFASPLMVSKMVMNIAAGLSKINVNGAGKYYNNAVEYAKAMTDLNKEFAAAGENLKNNRIIEPHGVFDYLARDMGLEIVAVLQAHGQEPSAAKMLKIIKIIKVKKPGAIFTEPQYPEKSALTLAKETGLSVAKLDPVASGPDDAPIDYYQMVMRKNLQTIINTLGVK